MINPPEHKPGSSYTEHELGEKPKEWKRVILPIKPDIHTIKTTANRPAPVRTPLDWNWTALITYSIIGYIAYRLISGLYHLIINSI